MAAFADGTAAASTAHTAGTTCSTFTTLRRLARRREESGTWSAPRCFLVALEVAAAAAELEARDRVGPVGRVLAGQLVGLGVLELVLLVRRRLAASRARCP